MHPIAGHEYTSFSCFLNSTGDAGEVWGSLLPLLGHGRVFHLCFACKWPTRSCILGLWPDSVNPRIMRYWFIVFCGSWLPWSLKQQLLCCFCTNCDSTCLEWVPKPMWFLGTITLSGATHRTWTSVLEARVLGTPLWMCPVAGS